MTTLKSMEEGANYVKSNGPLKIGKMFALGWRVGIYCVEIVISML